jgi:hypothetical protein
MFVLGFVPLRRLRALGDSFDEARFVPRARVRRRDAGRQDPRFSPLSVETSEPSL